MLLSRREFLRSSSVLLVTAASAGCQSGTGAGRIPIGVQLYCVRRELRNEMEGTLASLAEAGFEGVEFADYFDRSAEELRKLLDDNGLKCCGTHIYLEDMLGEKLEPTVEFNQTLGNPYLIVRALREERRNSKEAFAETTRLFAEVAENLKPYGMKVGYHNHDYIFESFNGKMLWNILADETPSDVILQLDTGNAAAAGVDVVALLERNSGRSTTIHLKPFSEENPDAYLGDDELNWKRILELCETSGGTEWYIVEYEREGRPPLEALQANLKRLNELLA